MIKFKFSHSHKRPLFIIITLPRNNAEGLTPQKKISYCLIIFKSKNKYQGHISGNTAAFHHVV